MRVHWSSRCSDAVRWVPLKALLLLLLEASTATAAEPSIPPPFHLPPITDPNITERTTGYNAWMTKYTGHSPVDEPVFILLTGGCLPLDEGGSSFYQDAGTGFRQRCQELGIACQCRPAINPTKWNPPQNDSSIYQDRHECVWEIQRVLAEHRQGLIKVGGISAKCSFQNPELGLFQEARDLGIPLFLMGVNKPIAGDPEDGLDQPTGFIGTDQAFLGRTMARLLKQLMPSGGTYAFVMSWTSVGMSRRRYGFVEEMSKDDTQEDRPSYHELDVYPFEKGVYWDSCHYMDCQMERLANPPKGYTIPDALIFLFQSPIRHDNYTTWVDAYRDRNNMTLIAMDALSYLHYLSRDYVDGLVGQNTYEMGKRSAEVLSEVYEKGLGGPTGVVLPPDTHLFETRLVSYNKIPLELDKLFPLELDQNLLDSLSIVGFVCFGIVLSTAMICALWTLSNRGAVVVRAAQPFFLLILIGGIVILSSSLIPLSLDDNGTPAEMSDRFAVAVCMSQPWLAFTGFSVVFSALFSKTWRVNRLFHASRASTSGSSAFTRAQVTTQEVLAPFAVIFTSNMVILICWTVLDPLTYVRLVGDGTDFWNRDIETYGACRSDKALAFLAPLAIINFMVLGIACWQAFEGRHIESEFSESKYIGFSVASLFQGFLTGIPILVVVKDEPRAFYLVLVLMIFVLSEAILLLIFLPKILLAREYSGMTEAEQRKAMSERIQRSSTSKMKGGMSFSYRQSGASDRSSSARVSASRFFRARAESAMAKMEESEKAGELQTQQQLQNANNNASSLLSNRDAIVGGASSDVSGHTTTFSKNSSGVDHTSGEERGTSRTLQSPSERGDNCRENEENTLHASEGGGRPGSGETNLPIDEDSEGTLEEPERIYEA